MCTNKATFFFLFLGVIISQTSFSQKNYLEGFVINMKGEKISGLISYKNWKQNPYKISFKENKNSQVIFYSPLQIKEFKVKDEIYKSAIVDKEISSRVTHDLDDHPRLHLKKDTIFLQTLIEGDKSLYYLKDKKNKAHFYIKEDNTYKYLRHKTYLRKKNGKEEIGEVKEYLGQLGAYLNDCPSLYKKLSSTKYERESIEKLFKFYYDCTHSDVSFKKERERMKFRFGVLAGMSLIKLEFINKELSSNSGYSYLSKIDIPVSLDPLGGVSLNIILPRNLRNWSLHSEVLLMKYSGSDILYKLNTNNQTYKAKTAYVRIKTNLMARYQYPIGKSMELFANVGMVYGQIIQNNSKGNPIFFPVKHQISATGGFGIYVKKFSFELRHERGNGAYVGNAVIPHPRIFSALVGYGF